MYRITSTRDGEVEYETDRPTLELAISWAIEDAKSNGYVPSISSERDLRETLKNRKYYEDGDALVSIRRVL